MGNELTQVTKVAVFRNKRIRKTIYNNEWWFSVVDVVQVLTDQPDDFTARKYWNKLSQRLREEGSELVTICHRLKLDHPDGFTDNRRVSRRGGNVAGVARKKLEQETGKKVVTGENYLRKPQNKKLIDKKGTGRRRKS